MYSHLEKRTDIVPDAQTFISLIETYAGRRDVQGAESMLNKFKDASRSERVQWTCDGVVTEQELNERARTRRMHA